MSKIVELDWNPSDRILRDFGFIALLGFSGLAAMAWFEVFLFSVGLGDARKPVAIALAAVGLLSALFSLVLPRANRAIYVLLSVVTYPIGLVVSYVLMALLFFGLFAPVGILFRLIGRDILQLRSDQRADSYWLRARPPRPRKRYFRQF